MKARDLTKTNNAPDIEKAGTLLLFAFVCVRSAKNTASSVREIKNEMKDDFPLQKSVLF